VDLKTTLLDNHSKAQALQITEAILADPGKLQELWALIRHGEPPLPQRASWPLDTISEAAPHLFAPYIEEAVEMLSQPSYHNAVHRNLAKVLMRLDIPEGLQGPLYDICLEKLLNPKEKAAIQVHCMAIAHQIAKGIPELKEELAIVIEEGMEYGSAGYRSRGRKVLKALKKKG